MLCIESLTVYISGRPFVLRDASEPKRTLSMSDRAENLEAIEIRLKNDILQEAARWVVFWGRIQYDKLMMLRFGGLLLTHNEMGKTIIHRSVPHLSHSLKSYG